MIRLSKEKISHEQRTRKKKKKKKVENYTSRDFRFIERRWIWTTRKLSPYRSWARKKSFELLEIVA